MPRLSVDIDLTYLPVEDRATSLAVIDAAMLRIENVSNKESETVMLAFMHLALPARISSPS